MELGARFALYYCANELNQCEATGDAPNDCPSPSETFDYDLDDNLIEVYLPGDVDRNGVRRAAGSILVPPRAVVDLPAQAGERPTELA